MKYKHLVYAGTFDRLHIGHKKLLDKAFELAEKVSIGLTTNEMIKRKLLSQIIEKWEYRKDRLEAYIRNRNRLDRVYFFKLNDIYGPSITSTSLSTSEDNDFDSILVTEQTKRNAEKINEVRLKKRLNPLEIVVEPMVRGTDREIVTSERIRLGEIDKDGRSYELLAFRNDSKELILPKEMRQELRKPLGKVIKGSIDRLTETARKILQSINPLRHSSSEASRLKISDPLVIAVGDIITNSLIEAGFDPGIKIIDLRSRRKEVTVSSNSNQPTLKLRLAGKKKQDKFINRAGTINIKTALEIKKSINEFINKGKNQLLIIEGEEDLLALPAILFSPLHSLVLYGQFDQGVILVEVTEGMKREVLGILQKFK